MPFHGDFMDWLTSEDVVDDIWGFFSGQNGAPGGGSGFVPPGGNGNGGGGGVVAPNRLGGCDVEIPIAFRNRAYCQPGYVAVDKSGDGVNDTCMLKEVAIKCGYYKNRPAALLTASDRRTLSRASSVMRKVDTVVKQTNRLRGQAKLTKTKSSR